MHTLTQLLQKRVLVIANPMENVMEVALRMVAGGVGAVPVLEAGRLVGIFSERDLMTRVVVPGLDPAATRLDSVMTRDVVTATLADRTRDCETKMQRAGCRHLPVLDGGRVVAVLSMRDLLRDEIEEQEAENRELRAYVQQHPVAPAR